MCSEAAETAECRYDENKGQEISLNFVPQLLSTISVCRTNITGQNVYLINMSQLLQ